MRAANYSSMNIFNKEQVKEINNVIKENFIEGKDDYAADSHKTSNVKFVNLGKIQKYIHPFIIKPITMPPLTSYGITAAWYIEHHLYRL